MNSIKMFKLVSGEEVIAEILEENDSILKIRNPVIVALIPQKTATNGPNFGFVPFSFTTNDKEFELCKEKIIFIGNTVSNEFLDQYNQLFSSIITPPSSILM